MAFPNSKLRRRIAFEAAQLIYQRQESEYYTAKMKSARRICKGWVKPQDLPSNVEIRDQLQSMARTFEGEERSRNLRDMRLEALRLMRILHRFRPRLIGSVLTGHVRRGSDIDLHLFSDGLESILAALDREGAIYDVERKRVRKHGEERIFTHIHLHDRFKFEMTVYPVSKLRYVFKSSVTGKAMERASIAQLEQFLMKEYPDLDLERAIEETENEVDRFQLYESLLLPLEHVRENPKFHPESDALYHSLQVFDLACNRLPYDEEFLLAALLHDVGKAIDPADHVAAGLEALEGFISPRTHWLIAHHMDVQQIREGTIGVRAKRRLRENESYEELLLLGECDRAGRKQGVEASELEDAIDYLRDLTNMCGE